MIPKRFGNWFIRQPAAVIAATYVVVGTLFAFVPWGVSALIYWLTGSAFLSVVVFIALPMSIIYYFVYEIVKKDRKKQTEVRYNPPSRFPDG